MPLHPLTSLDISDKQINEGESAKFSARIAAYPEPSVEWLKDGKPISDANAKIGASGDLHTLEIAETQLDQAGEITILAKNSLGQKSQNAQLVVKEHGTAPKFTRELEERLVDEHDRLVMEAQLDAKIKPKPNVSWFKDNKRIESSEKMRLEYIESSGILRLTIPSAEMSDKCKVTIKAENSCGVAETSGSIGVQKKSFQTKPQFLSALAPITVTEGDSLQTKVIISGSPAPLAKWYINDQLVCQTEDTEIKNQEGVYSLVIHGCTTDMSGKMLAVNTHMILVQGRSSALPSTEWAKPKQRVNLKSLLLFQLHLILHCAMLFAERETP